MKDSVADEYENMNMKKEHREGGFLFKTGIRNEKRTYRMSDYAFAFP